MTKSAASERLLPMYQSYSTFITFLDWVRDMSTMPSQFDRSLWVGKFAGGSGGQLMTGLRFLKLLDGEKPTDRLRDLVEADVAQRKVVLAQIMQDAYGQDVIVKLPSMTPAMLTKALDELGATDSTRGKAFSFLVNAAKAIDLPIADGIKKKARNKPSRVNGPRRSGGTSKGKTGGDERIDPPPPMRSPAAERSGVYAVVHALVDQLPSDQQWSATRRELWLQAILSNVDWLVAQMPDSAGEAAVGNNGEAPGLRSQLGTPGASKGESRDV